MLNRLFFLTLMMPHILWAKVVCDGETSISKIQAYRTCQTTWTKGICGLALGHLTASGITELTRKTLLDLAKENADVHAREHWDMLRKNILEPFAEKGEGLSAQIMNLQSEYEFENKFLKSLLESHANALTDLVRKSDFNFIKNEYPELYEKLMNYIEEENRHNDAIEQFIQNPEDELIGQKYDRAIIEKEKIFSRNKKFILRVKKLVVENIEKNIKNLRNQIVDIDTKLKVLLGKQPVVKMGLREVNALIEYSDLAPNIRQRIKDEVRVFLENDLKSNSTAAIRRAVRTIINVPGGKSLAKQAVLRYPQLATFFASRGLSKLALYGLGALGAIDLFLVSDNLGCGDDIHYKQYTNIDPETCRPREELAQNNLDFLNLPEAEQNKMLKENWALETHYKNICDNIFNKFELVNFTCSGSRISIDANYLGSSIQQEIRLKESFITEFVLSPGQSVETTYKINKNGIYGAESASHKKRTSEVYRERASPRFTQDIADAYEIKKQTDFWGSRFLIYADDIKSCCNEKGQAFIDCKKNILTIYSKDPDNTSSVGAP